MPFPAATGAILAALALLAIFEPQLPPRDEPRPPRVCKPLYPRYYGYRPSHFFSNKVQRGAKWRREERWPLPTTWRRCADSEFWREPQKQENECRQASEHSLRSPMYNITTYLNFYHDCWQETEIASARAEEEKRAKEKRKQHRHHHQKRSNRPASAQKISSSPKKSKAAHSPSPPASEKTDKMETSPPPPPQGSKSSRSSTASKGSQCHSNSMTTTTAEQSRACSSNGEAISGTETIIVSRCSKCRSVVSSTSSQSHVQGQQSRSASNRSSAVGRGRASSAKSATSVRSGSTRTSSTLASERGRSLEKTVELKVNAVRKDLHR